MKSSYSGTNGNCVDVMHDTTTDQFLVTDTKTYGQLNPPCLVFTRAEWSAFLAGVRAGEFDFGEPEPEPLVYADGTAVSGFDIAETAFELAVTQMGDKAPLNVLENRAQWFFDALVRLGQRGTGA